MLTGTIQLVRMEQTQILTEALVKTICDSIIIPMNHRVNALTHRFVLIHSEGAQWALS